MVNVSETGDQLGDPQVPQTETELLAGLRRHALKKAAGCTLAADALAWLTVARMTESFGSPLQEGTTINVTGVIDEKGLAQLRKVDRPEAGQ